MRSEAVKLLLRRQAEMGSGKLVAQSVERTTFEDLVALIVDDYKINGRRSLDRTELSISHLKKSFGRNFAIEITHDRICSYVRRRMEHAAPGTVRLELSALKR